MKKLLNLKRLLKARNSSGFTLVEVILSCALLAILILGIMMFVTPVLRMVTSGQKNARATMLAETVDTYIAGVLRTAKKIEVFENVDFSSSATTDLNLRALSPAGQGINKIEEFMTTGENSMNYEVHAIAIVAKDTGDITSQGIRIYNASVDSAYNLVAASLYPDKNNQALNDLMYEGLYATVKLDTFETQDPSTGAETGHNASGYSIQTLVYSDSKCYNVLQETRDKSILAFEGVTFFQNLNMSTEKNADDSVGAPAEPIITVSDVQSAMDGHTAEDGKLFYPGTIIVYVSSRK